MASLQLLHVAAETDLDESRVRHATCQVQVGLGTWLLGCSLPMFFLVKAPGALKVCEYVLVLALRLRVSGLTYRECISPGWRCCVLALRLCVAFMASQMVLGALSCRMVLQLQLQ